MGKHAEFIAMLANLLREQETRASAPDPLTLDVTPAQSPSTYSRVATPRGSGQTVILPFHFHLWNLRGDHSTSSTQAIDDIPEFATLTSGYRRAEFLELSVRFQPTHRALKYPFTVELLWVPKDRVMSRKTLLSSYGMQSLVIGDSQVGASHLTVSADLSAMNPVIKDSVSYNDTPKLFTCYRPNDDLVKLFKKKTEDTSAGPPILCCVVIMGKIKLWSPAANFTEASEASNEE